MRERVKISEFNERKFFFSNEIFFFFLQFERQVINTCTRINATENIRGINYKFNKNGFDMNNMSRKMYPTTGTSLKPHYVRIFLSFLFF